MPRIPRNNMETSFFHIIVQGIEKSFIFNTKEDIEKYIELLYKKNEDVLLIAYCIMNNHAHILIKVDDIIKLEKWMQKVNTSFARYYNKKNERVGYVFKSRYHSQPIMSETHLHKCLKYIHDNPVKANICESAKDYKYSSFYTIYKADIKKIYSNLDNILNDRSEIKKVKSNKKENIDKFDDNFIFMEYNSENQEKVCEEVIEQFRRENKQDLDENNENLIKLVKRLKLDFGISYRLTAKYMGINREKLRRIMKNSEK